MRLLLLVAGLIGSLALCGPTVAMADPNVVAQYLANADRQYETDEQRTEIIRALEDMLTEKPEVLRVRRYADYQGNKNAWSLTTLIRQYFVPVQRMPDWSEDAFYRDVSKPEARQAIREQLSALKKDIPPH